MMICAGHVAKEIEKRNIYQILDGRSQGTRAFARHRDGSMKCLFEKQSMKVWAVLSWLKKGSDSGL
jgi:hypothetical protein